jgi:hypothetical protein
MSLPALPIVADLHGHRVSRDEVLRNEAGRITAAARKLGIADPTGRLAERREALLSAKLDLGTDEIDRRLAREIAAAGAVTRGIARVSARRRTSVTDLYVATGSAQRFVEYFEGLVDENDEQAMLRAHPDHFVQSVGADGYRVVETTGGSPFATEFLIDYDDLASLVTPTDPAFSFQMAGVARSKGAAIGGVRHQFRDTPDGFHARLTVEFPLPTPPWMVSGHRMHLAVEFSNWIEAAFAV